MRRRALVGLAVVALSGCYIQHNRAGLTGLELEAAGKPDAAREAYAESLEQPSTPRGGDTVRERFCALRRPSMEAEVAALSADTSLAALDASFTKTTRCSSDADLGARVLELRRQQAAERWDAEIAPRLEEAPWAVAAEATPVLERLDALDPRRQAWEERLESMRQESRAAMDAAGEAHPVTRAVWGDLHRRAGGQAPWPPPAEARAASLDVHRTDLSLATRGQLPGPLPAPADDTAGGEPYRVELLLGPFTTDVSRRTGEKTFVDTRYRTEMVEVEVPSKGFMRCGKSPRTVVTRTYSDSYNKGYRDSYSTDYVTNCEWVKPPPTYQLQEQRIPYEVERVELGSWATRRTSVGWTVTVRGRDWTEQRSGTTRLSREGAFARQGTPAAPPSAASLWGELSTAARDEALDAADEAARANRAAWMKAALSTEEDPADRVELALLVGPDDPEARAVLAETFPVPPDALADGPLYLPGAEVVPPVTPIVPRGFEKGGDGLEGYPTNLITLQGTAHRGDKDLLLQPQRTAVGASLRNENHFQTWLTYDQKAALQISLIWGLTAQARTSPDQVWPTARAQANEPDEVGFGLGYDLAVPVQIGLRERTFGLLGGVYPSHEAHIMGSYRTRNTSVSLAAQLELRPYWHHPSSLMVWGFGVAPDGAPSPRGARLHVNVAQGWWVTAMAQRSWPRTLFDGVNAEDSVDAGRRPLDTVSVGVSFSATPTPSLR